MKCVIGVTQKRIWEPEQVHEWQLKQSLRVEVFLELYFPMILYHYLKAFTIDRILNLSTCQSYRRNILHSICFMKYSPLYMFYSFLYLCSPCYLSFQFLIAYLPWINYAWHWNLPGPYLVSWFSEIMPLGSCLRISIILEWHSCCRVAWLKLSWYEYLVVECIGVCLYSYVVLLPSLLSLSVLQCCICNFMWNKFKNLPICLE